MNKSKLIKEYEALRQEGVDVDAIFWGFTGFCQTVKEYGMDVLYAALTHPS